MPENVSLRQIMDERSAGLVERTLTALGEAGDQASASSLETVEAGLLRLRTIWVAIEAFPRLQDCQTLGRRRRDLDTLLETFTRAEPYTIDAYLPTRATLARTYGMAKFNFFRMLGYVIEDRLHGEGDGATLLAEVQTAGRRAAASLIAEDVLRSIACDDQLELPLRRLAARWLARFWDQRTTRNLGDFAPQLDSAWQAKAKVQVAYGTLAGVSELLQLSLEGLDTEFVDIFGDDACDDEQRWALEEFLFNALYEELDEMRAHMKESGKSALEAADVAKLFGVDAVHLHRTTMTAEDLFFTFREREMWARLRRLTLAVGPKKTAEEHVMIAVLGRRLAEEGEATGPSR